MLFRSAGVELAAGIFVLRGGYHAPSDKEAQALERDEGPTASFEEGTEPDRAGPIGAQPRTTVASDAAPGPSVRNGLAESGPLPGVNDAAPRLEP